MKKACLDKKNPFLTGAGKKREKKPEKFIPVSAGRTGGRNTLNETGDLV